MIRSFLLAMLVFGCVPWARSQCVPVSMTFCAGVDDVADVWVNGTSMGSFAYVNSGGTLPCVTMALPPPTINTSGLNLVAVRLWNTQITQAWASWSADITCADGSHAYWTSSTGTVQLYDNLAQCTPTPPAGGPGQWTDPSFTPVAGGIAPAMVTGYLYGRVAQDPFTGIFLTPIAANVDGSSSDTCEVMFFRQSIGVLPITNTPTVTSTHTLTNTFTPTSTNTRTNTGTPTFSRTSTFTRTATLTATPTLTRTYTLSPTASLTPTVTRTPTFTRTLTHTFTPTNTSTHTLTPTITPTFPPGDLIEVSRNVMRPGLESPALNMRIRLRQAGWYVLEVFNSAGEKVKGLRQGRSVSPVYEDVGWDGTNDRGEPVASGLYIVHLMASYDVRTVRVLLLR